jgi:hypothetical protein
MSRGTSALAFQGRFTRWYEMVDRLFIEHRGSMYLKHAQRYHISARAVCMSHMIVRAKTPASSCYHFTPSVSDLLGLLPIPIAR